MRVSSPPIGDRVRRVEDRDLVTGGAQDVLTIQRYAHLVGGARMGTSAADLNERKAVAV